jgi:trehalose/maltose hydrolase-like predicted phosphorylase
MLPGAQANYREWLAAGRPMARGKLGPAPAVDAAMYPWESSVSGRETVVGRWIDPHAGPSRHEIHITGSVLWGLEQATALGLADPKGVAGVGRRAAAFYLQRARRRADGRYEIPWVMSPDENHIGGNDLYTNILAKRVIDKYAREQFPRGIPLVLPHDSKSFLTYDGDRHQAYKQAAAILAIYPLQYPPAEREASVMMKRYASRVKDTGPAMSRSIDALIWARMGKVDEAYVAWHQSWENFVKPPLMLFAEKRQVPVTYFTTGAAGSLQTVLFGFLGFRIDSQKDPAAGWSKKLIGEHWLSIKPNLPKAWKSVKFRNFWLLGRRYTLFATHTGVTVTQGD